MSLFRGKFFAIITVATVGVLSAMAVSTIDFSKSPAPSDAIGLVVTPLQSLFSGIGNSVNNFFSSLAEVGSLREKNISLLAQVDEYERQTREIQELRLENEELRRLLELKQRSEIYDTVGAQIVSKDTGNWLNTFVINKGTLHGLAKNCVVMSDKGIVGHIYEIGTNWAKVITLIDPNYGVGAFIARTNDTAVIEGDLILSRQGMCKLSYLEKSANIIEGDFVETSGIGSIYPRGLLIGRVKEVHIDTQGLSSYAIVSTEVDFAKITSVLVIK